MPAGGMAEMSNALAIIILLAALFIALRRYGVWRQRARMAEEALQSVRRAQKIQSDVALDSAVRERVRRAFDRP